MCATLYGNREIVVGNSWSLETDRGQFLKLYGNREIVVGNSWSLEIDRGQFCAPLEHHKRQLCDV